MSSFGSWITNTGTALTASLLMIVMPSRAVPAQGAVTRSSRIGMARIPAGKYAPLYGRSVAPAVRVSAFRLDRRAATRGQFLAFVRHYPEWRRGNVRPSFAAQSYLADWPGPLDAGRADDLAQPVTSVSWFAARAYCAAQGKRLPTVDEWEYAAAASETVRDATRDPVFINRLLSLYATQAAERQRAGRGFRNVYGLEGMHGGPWEWTEDFDNVLISGDSRETAGLARETAHGAVCASAAIGATDPANYAAFLRFSFRSALNTQATVSTLGFRCAAGA